MRIRRLLVVRINADEHPAVGQLLTEQGARVVNPTEDVNAALCKQLIHLPITPTFHSI